MSRIFLMLGALFGLLSVAFGAFGAHAIRARVDERMFEIWNTAAEYQMTHALALIAAAWVASNVSGRAPVVAGWAFVVGICVFSGSLYTLVLSGQRWLGAITPIGGVAMIVGWAALLFAATKMS